MADRVLPILRLAVLCERIDGDGTERPVVLLYPVHTLRFPAGVEEEYRPREPFRLYVQLQGGRGMYFFRVVMRAVSDTREVTVAHFDHDLNAADEIYPLETDVKLDRLVFPKPDVYELMVYANAVNLHEPTDAVPIPYPPICAVALPAAGSPGDPI